MTDLILVYGKPESERCSLAQALRILAMRPAAPILLLDVETSLTYHQLPGKV